MKKTKKTSTHGSVGVEVMRLLNEYPDMTNRQIAKDVGCSIGYVYNLRKKMVHVPPCEDVLELTPEMEEVLHKVTSGTGRTPSKSDDLNKVLDARGSQYGNFLDHARITQRLKNVAHQFASENGKRFDVDQAEALDMIFHKIGRILNGNPNYADSWVDIAGYAKLVADRLEGKIR